MSANKSDPPLRTCLYCELIELHQDNIHGHVLPTRNSCTSRSIRDPGIKITETLTSIINTGSFYFD